MPGYIGIGAAERSYPLSEVRGHGREELPHVEGQRQLPRQATAGPRSGVAAEAAARARRAKRSYSTFKVRRGSCEEIPLVQGKEQKLRFTGAALKRYPTSKVRETQVRWQVSQEASEGRHTNHNHRKLINLKTRTTALSNSETKPYRVWPPKTGGSWWRGLTECGPLEKGMANHFSILALRTP